MIVLNFVATLALSLGEWVYVLALSLVSLINDLLYFIHGHGVSGFEVHVLMR